MTATSPWKESLRSFTGSERVMVAENDQNVPTNNSESHEILRAACRERGIKWIAPRLGLTPGMVHKWTELATGSGSPNPLDRTVQLYHLTGSLSIVNFVCESAGGFFCANPIPLGRESMGRHALQDCQKLTQEFSEMLGTTLAATVDGVCEDDARNIRQKWEDLKRAGESLVVAAERGSYAAAVAGM